ncbi:MAG: SHOCT domain-containing protein [Chloroflexi bacterium]|nr:MAG: SHOCT domain-containing protein [Chloroflexota bacterium]
MKISFGTLLGTAVLFIFCLFLGVTVVSIGLGALFPPLNLVAKPFVCPSGQMTYEEIVSRPLPGTTYTLIYWFCTDNQTGAKTQLEPFPKDLYAGIVYGLLLFVAGWISYRLYTARNALEPAKRVQASAAGDQRAREAGSGGAKTLQEVERELKKLKAMRASNVISEAEYDKTRAEILKDL